ncbi:reverse transcriptase domain-containing protein [Tanacetum coccineum]
MSPLIRRKYRTSVAFATGCRGINKSSRCNRKIRVPIAMWSCKVEENMTLKEVDGKTIQEFETKIIAKDDTITRVPGTFQDYEMSKEELVERPRKRDLYGFVDHPQLQQRSHRSEFAPRRLSQPDGNMNGWLLEDEDEVERNEVDSDLESTTNIPNLANPWSYDERWMRIALTRWIEETGNAVIDNTEDVWAATAISWNYFKALMVEEFCPSNEMEKLENEFWNHKMVGANHASYTDRFHELAKLVPHLVTPESSRIKRYIAGLALEIRGMLQATQPTTIQNAILRAGILTDEAVSCDNKKARTGTRFVATAPTRNETVGYYPRQAALVNDVRMDNNPRVCHECGSPDHFRNTCPKLNRAPVQTGNQLAIEGSQNNRSNGKQVRGRAYNVNVNAMEAVQDPNIVTGTFSLNDHFVTVLFDSGANFSFISTEFAPLLNVKPSIVNPGRSS